MEQEPEKQLKKYEIGFLVKSEEDRDNLIKILENRHLTIINVGPVSRIKLTYPIKKENFAYSGYLRFSASPEDIRELSYDFKMQLRILRFIIISRPILEEVRVGVDAQERVKPLAEHHQRQRISLIERDVSKAENGYQENFDSGTVPPQSSKRPQKVEVLSNEALEKKLEEILK